MNPPATTSLRALAACVTACILALFPRATHAFSYVFADQIGANTVTHSIGYTGVGGNIVITIGINPASLHASEMVVSAENAIFRWNELAPTLGNLGTLGVSGAFDFESVLLHELGHALGLDHPNLGDASGVSVSNSEFTRTTKGSNTFYDFGAGADGVQGSGDDVRGDDVNLNWFRKSNNDPFTIAPVIDSTTYSRDLAQLPAGNNFSANASRQLAAITPGAANSEAVMQQGSFTNEIQRTLGPDDVAGIRFAMSGLDELAGTADDYTLQLNFLGLATGANIMIGFDDTQTSFALTKYSGAVLNSEHLALTAAQLYFNSGANWYFNQTSVIPEPASAFMLAGGALLLGSRRPRRR